MYLGRDAAMNPERPAAATLTVCGGGDRGGAVNSELVVRALNYHGQQLTSFLKENPLYPSLDLRSVDYHLYHQRSRELRMEDRGKRLLLHRFISQKTDRLFREEVGDMQAVQGRVVRDQVEEHAALLPPLEAFTPVHEDDRCRHFFEAVLQGDTIFCRIVSKAASGLMLSVLCLDPATGKSRYIEDAKIRCFCPSAEMVPPSDTKEPHRVYDTGDLVRVVVLEVKVESQRLLAGMHSTSLPPLTRNQIKLGLVTVQELPATHTYTTQALAKSIPYSTFLERSVGFINPTNVAHLAGELGLDTGSASLLGDLAGSFPPECMVASIRREQASKWAFKHVAQGIKYFKAGSNVEAFQCLNQALNIDGENVEGLVARGALFANNGGLEKAVGDFETALRINPTHRNAKKYMCETLIAVARNFEDEEKVEPAIETYERILRVVPDHKEAVDSLLFLRGRPKGAPLRDDLPGATREADKNTPRLRLEEEVKERRSSKGSEKSEKKKKRRHRSSSSSSSSSDSSRSRKMRKKRKKSRTSPSLSPFSSKLAVSAPAAPLQPIVLDSPSPVAAAPLPDLRADIERLKSGVPPAVAGPAPGFPLIDLTKPPPGYVAFQQQQYSSAQDKEYDDKVAKFLQDTAAGGVKERRERHRSGRSRSSGRRSRSRRSRSRGKSSKSRHRSRSKERTSSSSSKKAKKERSRSREKKSKKKKSRSRSIENKSKKKSRSKSRSISRSPSSSRAGGRNRSGGGGDLLDDAEFAARLDTQLAGGAETGVQKEPEVRKDNKGVQKEPEVNKEKKSVHKEPEGKGGWRPVVGEVQEVVKPAQQSSRAVAVVNVFGSDDESSVEVRRAKEVVKAPVGGMWVPTGSDSILEGVKEAKNRLQEKQARRSSRGEREEDGRRRVTELAPPPTPDYEVTFEPRTGMYVRVPRVRTVAEKVASQGMEMDKGEEGERVVRKVLDSPPRMPKRRSRSRERRSYRSRSRGRRSRSRSRGKRRSRSRDRRGKERGLDRQSSNTQLNTLQREVMGMQDETRRLQKEREAIEKEKAALQEVEKTAAARTAARMPRDEFRGMETVMSSVLEAVGPRPASNKRLSPLVKPSKIIPGAQTFEDLEAFLKRKKDEKLEELKKKK